MGLTHGMRRAVVSFKLLFVLVLLCPCCCTADNNTSTDIDVCITEVTLCQTMANSHCVDLTGGYECVCNDGYEEATIDDRKTCINSTVDKDITRSSTNITHPIVWYFTIIIGILGALGNGFVLATMSCSQQLRKPTTNKLIMHQCFIDFMGGTILFFQTLFEDITVVPHGQFTVVFCALWLSKYFQWVTFFTSTANLVLLTIEKYLSVFHLNFHDRSYTACGIALNMICAWVYGLAINVDSIVTTKMKDNVCHYSAFWTVDETAFVVVVNVVLNECLPLLVFVICYGRIAWFFHRMFNRPATRLSEVHLAKMNSVKTLIVVAVGFFICWTPNNIYYPIHQIAHGKYTDLRSPIYHITVLVAFCNTMINPIIYVIMFKSFQREVKRLICRIQTPTSLESNAADTDITLNDMTKTEN